MAKKIFVTGAQVAAAKAIVKRDAARGKPTRTAVKKIASAAVHVDSPSTNRAALSS